MASEAQNKLLRLQCLPVTQLQRVRIDEARVSYSGMDLNARAFQMADQLLLLLNTVDHPLGAVEQAGEVQSGEFPEQTILRALFCITAQPGGLGQHPSGHATVVGASAAHAIAF